MKQILNRKKLLKATFALSGVVLFGCTAQNTTSSDEWYMDQSTPPAQQESVVLAEEEIINVEPSNPPCAPVPCVMPGSATPASPRRAVAASTPAEPRVVPVKPARTKMASTKKATDDIVVKQKPQIVELVPTSGTTKDIDNIKETKSDKVSTTTETVTISESVTETTNAPIPETKPNVPVIEKNIEAVDVSATDTTGVAGASDIAILETTVDETKITDVQEDMAKIEAERLAAEEAKAAKEAKAAEEARLAKEAAEKAEKEKLQKELEALQAEKKTLEEERIRITQIQQTTKESCEDVKDWVAAEGTTLRSLLMDWGDRVGWRVVWNMDRDYTLEAGAVFRGRFVDVSAALLRSFARATPAPKGVFYKGNKVLVISTREDENAD